MGLNQAYKQVLKSEIKNGALAFSILPLKQVAIRVVIHKEGCDESIFVLLNY